LHCFSQTRDQIAAAVRLGLLGPAAAQKIQAQILERVEANPDLDAELPVDSATKTSPFGEVGPGCHGFLYSKLFRN
jgi:urease accessory protein UreF